MFNQEFPAPNGAVDGVVERRASSDNGGLKEAVVFAPPSEPNEIVAFAPDDPNNPFNWSSVSYTQDYS